MIAGMGRSGGGDELEVDEDGAWRALRSGGAERAGRFGGRLDAGTLDALKAEVAAAAEAGPAGRDDPWPAGGAVDTFWAGEVVAQLGQDEEAPDGWGGLVARCRAMLDGATEAPLAAVEASAAGDGAIRHAGAEPLPIGASGFAVEATLFAADSALLESWTTTVPAPGDGVVAPGWEAPIGLSSSGLSPEGGQTLAVSITFALGQGLPRPMNLWVST